MMRIPAPVAMITVVAGMLMHCGGEQSDANAIMKTRPVAVILKQDTGLKVDPIAYSATITLLKKAQKVDVLRRSAERSWIGNSRNYWYEVLIEKGIKGWVFGSDVKLFNDRNDKGIDQYVHNFWKKEEKLLRTDLKGKWWSVDKLGEFTEHCIELEDDGSYLSYQKGGDKIKGVYSFNFKDNELKFDKGTSFKQNLNFVRRGTYYFLEHNTKDLEIKFKKLQDLY